MGKIERIQVPPDDRERLNRLVSDRNTPQKVVWRARIVLLAGDGVGSVAISATVGMSVLTVRRWRRGVRPPGRPIDLAQGAAARPMRYEAAHRGTGQMDKVKIHEGDWVVVCDGRKALILENVGDWKFPNLHTHEVKEHDLPSTHEQGTDAPGRVQASVGTATSAVEQTDWHHESERIFLEQLAGRLDVAVASGRPKRLIVIAPPRALGTLRQAFSPAVRAAVEAEIAHDYVKLPVGEIEKRLFG